MDRGGNRHRHRLDYPHPHREHVRLMTVTQTITLAAVAALAGAINAIAGGGTLLTFPTLLFCGTPERIANATSTLALVIGTAGSIFGFRKQVSAIKPWLWRFV